MDQRIDHYMMSAQKLHKGEWVIEPKVQVVKNPTRRSEGVSWTPTGKYEA